MATNKPTDNQSVGRATLTVSGLTLLSRFTGLARDAVLAAALGLSVWADIFFLAFLIPNLFRRLFGEGALTSAFIPAYTRIQQEKPAHAPRFAGSVLAWTLGITTAIAVMAVAGTLIALSLSEPDTRTSHTLTLTAWMLPYMPLVCLVAILGGLLQARGSFAPAAAAPVLLNLAMITAAIIASAQSDQPEAIAFALAFGVLIAGGLQLLWMITAATRRKLIEPPSADTTPDIRSMALRMLPMTAGLAVFQVNALLDHLIAFLLSPPTANLTTIAWLPQQPDYPIQTGSVAALQWAQRLYQFPLGVFGIAVATAAFPALARTASQPDLFRGVLRHGLSLALWLTLPASVGLALVADPLVALIYERGAFDPSDTARVAALLLAYGSAVWAYALTHVLTRACYALDHPNWPLRIMAATVPLNLILNLTLIWPLGAVGLAWSTALAAILQTVGLAFLLRRQDSFSILPTALRIILATAVMAAAVAFVDHQLSASPDVIRVIAAVTTGIGIYALVSWPLQLFGLLRTHRTG